MELNVRNDPDQFLHAMKACEAIISSSLHGLIFAEALGIPNLWVTPTDRLHEICEAKPCALVPVDECRSRPIPTFLISFDYGTILERVIASIKRLNRPTEIIIHDNGSSDATTLAILDKLERNGTRVVRRNAITSADDLI